MSNPHITELRHHLMATLADLRNRETPMEPDRARAVATVASALIDTARVENDYLRITGQDRSNFLEQPEQAAPVAIAHLPTPNNPFPSRLRHKLEA